MGGHFSVGFGYLQSIRSSVWLQFSEHRWMRHDSRSLDERKENSIFYSIICVNIENKMILLLVTLTFTLVASVPHEYNFNYPLITSHNSSSFLSSHHSRAQDSTYNLEDLFEYGDTSLCKKNATCVTVKGATCFGYPLPYNSISFDFIPGNPTHYMIKKRLSFFFTLKSIPKCWSVVQPFLCSLFMPKCVNGTIERLSQSMCTTVLSSCRLMLNQTIWPKFIRCDDEDLFLPQCHTVMRDMKFSKNLDCPEPLVKTNNSKAFFDGIDGCGIPCKDPLYTHEEHQQIHTFVLWGAATCGLLNLFAFITFIIDWRSVNKFPASAIFFINFNFTMCCMCYWFIKFFSGNEIVCRNDGTLRISEPNGDLGCVIFFVLIYYPIMSAIVWFVILTYTWHMSIQPYGKLNNRLDKKSAYFHLSAWCLPLMLTVGVMGMSEVDGDGVTGLCFVGRYNVIMRMGFVLGPVAVATLIGGYFLIRGLIRLINLTISSEGIISEKAISKLRNTIVRMGLFSVAIFLCVIITIHCHIYDFRNHAEWGKSFRDSIICSITNHQAELSSCKIESRPSVTKLQLHMFALFFSGIMMSSWVWTSSTVDIWLRFFKRYLSKQAIYNYYDVSLRVFIILLIGIYRLFDRDGDVSEPAKVKKHEVIAQAYNKNKTLGKVWDENGQLSMIYQNDDPVGLNFNHDIGQNSCTSQEVSATWVAALPRFVERRDAKPDIKWELRQDSMDSRFSNRRSSNDSSTYSFSLRRVSIESRRNSMDSQISVSIDELTARGQMPYREKRRTRRMKKHRGVKGFKVSKHRRTARGGVGNSQDTPAIEGDY